MRRSGRLVGAVLGALLALAPLPWGAVAVAKVVSFTVSNPVCTAVDLTRNQCAINLRHLSLTDDGMTSPFLSRLRIVIDGRVRLQMAVFFESVISYDARMVPQGLGVPCGLPNESGLGDATGKQYPVGIEPLGQNGTSMGSDIAIVLCPAAVPTTTTTTTSTTSTTAVTSTTTMTATTTTSMPPAGPCDGVPSGATIASISCRSQALLAAVQADGRLGRIQPNLVAALQAAVGREQDAQARCAAGKTKRARRRVRQAGKKLRRVVRRLRSKASRKTLPPEVREPLAAEASGLRTDTKALRRALTCPSG